MKQSCDFSIEARGGIRETRADRDRHAQLASGLRQFIGLLGSLASARRGLVSFLVSCLSIPSGSNLQIMRFFRHPVRAHRSYTFKLPVALSGCLVHTMDLPTTSGYLGAPHSKEVLGSTRHSGKRGLRLPGKFDVK